MQLTRATYSPDSATILGSALIHRVSLDWACVHSINFTSRTLVELESGMSAVSQTCHRASRPHVRSRPSARCQSTSHSREPHLEVLRERRVWLGASAGILAQVGGRRAKGVARPRPPQDGRARLAPNSDFRLRCLWSASSIEATLHCFSNKAAPPCKHTSL